MDLPRKIKKVKDYFDEFSQEICENLNSGTEKKTLIERLNHILVQEDLLA